MTELFDSVGSIIWRATWQSGLLALVVAAVIAVFRNRIAPRWQYALWSIVLVRLLLVTTPAAPWSAFNLVAKEKLFTPSRTEHAANLTPTSTPTEISQSRDTPAAAITTNEPVRLSSPDVSKEPIAGTPRLPANSMDATPPRVVGKPAVVPTVSLRSVLLCLWLLGCVIVAFRYVVGWMRLRRRLSACQPVASENTLMLLERASARVRLRLLRPKFLVTSEPTSPYVTGLVHPRIVLPESILETLGDDQIEFVLAHELAHLKRGDVWMQLVILIVQVMHWFNPLSWWTARQLRATREAACDDFVVHNFDDAARARYASTLLTVSSHLRPPTFAAGLIGLFHRRHVVAHRIRRLASRTTRSGWWDTGCVTLIAIVALFGLTDASLSAPVSSSTAAQDESTQEPDSDTVVIAGKIRDWQEAIKGESREIPIGVTVNLISVRGLRREARVIATTKSDAERRFRFEPVEAPSHRHLDGLQYYLAFEAPGWGKQYTLVGLNGEPEATRVYLNSKLGDAKGKVVDADGKPIVGARVRPNSLIPHAVPGYPVTTTNEAGLFRLGQMPISKKGIYLLVEHPDYLEKRVTVQPSGATITMGRGCVLTGSVLHKRTKEPIAGVVVSVRNEKTYSDTHVTTDAEGKFTARVPQGTYRLVLDDTDVVAHAIPEVECQSGASVKLKPFLASEGGWIVGKVVNTKTGQPLVRTERGDRVGLGYYGPSRNQGRVISPKILAEVDDHGRFRMRAAAGNNYPYFHNTHGDRMAWDTMKKSPVVVKDGAETEITLTFTPKKTPDELIADSRKVLAALPQQTDKRVAAIIEEFRKLNHTVDQADLWCLLVKELTVIGKDAVPALCREFEATTKRPMMQRLAFTLRAINDPRAVPTLIRCLPKTLMTSGSDFGLIVHDPDLLEFMQKHGRDGGRRGQHFSFGQVQKETHLALTRITKKKFDSGFLNMKRTGDRRSDAQKELAYHRAAERWAAWWESNWKSFKVDAAYSKVNLPKYTPKNSGPFATGREVPAGSKVSGGLIGMVLSPVGDADRGASFFFDLDTGRRFKWPKELPPDDSDETIELGKKWATDKGADLMCVHRVDENGKGYYVLIGLNLQLWEISSLDAENFKKRIAAGELPDGRKAGDVLLRLDPKTKKHIPRSRTSFVYVTKGDSLGMISTTDIITQVRNLTGTPAGMEPGGVGFHRGVKFNYFPVAR